MATSLLGTRVNRREDPALLRGEGHYVGDVLIESCLHAKFVRSEMAFADFSVDLSAAREVAGVVSVYDFETLEATMVEQRFVPDSSFARGALGHGTARYVGEPLAMVVAETQQAAHDAAEEVIVDYEPLPVRLDAEQIFAEEHGADSQSARDSQPDTASQPDADSQPRLLFPQRGSDTLSFAIREEPVSTEAHTVVTVRLENNRMAVAPLEGNAIAVVPHLDSGAAGDGTAGDGTAGDAGENGSDGYKLTVWLATQNPHENQVGIARSLGIEPEEVRLIAPWVGGGFGGKGGWVPEHIAVAKAAMLLDRPVRWLEDRTENLIGMQARHQIQYGRLSLNEEGKIQVLETHALADCGGYLEIGGLIPHAAKLMAQGVYKVPTVRSGTGAACTNKAPTTAFRGAGRPQATCMIERLMDVAAAEMGIDPVELRLRNLLQPEDFPYATTTGAHYDTGDYAKTLQKATELVDYERLRREQTERRQRGDTKLLGIGVCCYVEITAGQGAEDYASVEIGEDGKVLLKAGTSSHGQGHETVFATIVSEQLGVDIDDIVFVQSDTAEVPRGQGTGGSRSGQIGGSAVLGACERVLEDARRLASHLLEADESDIVVADGGLAVAGVPTAKLSWAELAAAAREAAESEDLPDRLWAENDFKQENATYPFGTHICVVELDTETGKVAVLRHVAVDDCGVVMNPMIVEGQQHGGIASGISQALWEHIVYDEDGNPRTTNFAEYLFPSAAEFPSFEAHSTQTPTDLNPLGVKGIGEAGTIGAIPATHNAVIDALLHLGVRHLDMPLTPEKIWQAIQQTKTSNRVPATDPPWPSYTESA